MRPLYSLEIVRKRQHLIENGLLHMDNAPAHRSATVQDALDIYMDLPHLPHPPYSPDTAPCDFYLFPTLKMPLKGKCFTDLAEVQKAVQNQLNIMSTNGFGHVFKAWVKRQKQVIARKGAYIEG